MDGDEIFIGNIRTVYGYWSTNTSNCFPKRNEEFPDNDWKREVDKK